MSGDAAHKGNIAFDITPQPGQMPGVSAGGWGHPHCGPGSAGDEIKIAALPPNK